MRLRSITFSNFRCFYGEQEIEFGINEDDYLTIIHAENGAGKTSLLNAILWTFYNTTTGKFGQPDKIVNQEAISNGKTVAWVEVKFEHLQSTYLARRSFRHGLKTQDETNSFRVTKISSDGHSVPEPFPKTFIESVIPPEIAKYFFFDGEHAESFVGAQNKKEVGAAVRNILGCGVLETAIEDLKDLESKADRELRAAARLSGLQDTVEVIEKLEIEIQKKKEAVKSAERMIIDEDSRLVDLKTFLKESSASRELQRQLERAQSGLLKAQKDKAESENKFIKWTDRNALPLVSEALLSKVDAVLKSNKQSNRIPEKYARPVIEELLQLGKCICGTNLEPGSLERKAVEELVSSSADEEHIERWGRVQASLVNLQRQKPNSIRQFKDAIEQRERAVDAIASYEQSIGSLDNNFKKIDDEEVQQVRKKIDSITAELTTLRTRTVRTNMAIEEDERDLANKKKNLDSQQKQQANLQALRVRHDLIQKARIKLEERLDNHVQAARGKISSDVNQMLRRIAHQPMKIVLSEDFNLNVIFEGNANLAPSTGEGQLVGLLFTAALISFSKLRANTTGEELVPGTVAPLFLDAPFGQLDTTYQEKIAEVLPELADQLCLMLSSSQCSPAVLDKLRPFGGRQYVLIRHNKTDAPEEIEDRSISLNGRKYEQTLWGQDISGSTLELVV